MKYIDLYLRYNAQVTHSWSPSVWFHFSTNDRPPWNERKLFKNAISRRSLPALFQTHSVNKDSRALVWRSSCLHDGSTATGPCIWARQSTGRLCMFGSFYLHFEAVLIFLTPILCGAGLTVKTDRSEKNETFCESRTTPFPPLLMKMAA